METDGEDRGEEPVMLSEPENVGELRAVLDDKIIGCQACVPWSDGEQVWRGQHTQLVDLLPWSDKKYGLDSNGALVQEVLGQYHCPRCNASLRGDSEVEHKSDQDKRAEETISEAVGQQMICRLKEFSDFLERYPYLGACDPDGTGRRIIDAIKATTPARPQVRTWFRARLLNNDSRVYHSREMTAPDPGKVFIKEGRYNHTGQAYLYLSDSKESALAEVCSDMENLCVIQEYRLEGVDSILDLTGHSEEFDHDEDVIRVAIIYNGFAGKNPDRRCCWKPEYFVPRFVADAARLRGFSGIQFSSAVTHGINLVLFDPRHRGCKQIGEPYLYQRSHDAKL